ncbi:MAG: Holliday junction resolvase [Gammaproteobacteria bacterium]|nr:Holliday junction resolvase [Gammaproteobacteria bacterium]
MEIGLAVLTVLLIVTVLLWWRTAARAKARYEEGHSVGVRFGREDSRQRSRSVNLGQVVEHLVPFMPDFPYDPKDAHFLGNPVDYVVFAGLREDNRVQEIVFVEVKSGSSKLTPRERSVKDAIENGRVSYWEARVSPERGLLTEAEE